VNLLLICETAIIEHIFSLICKKLNIELTVQKTNNVNDKFDLIVIDQNFIDDRFNIIKQFSKKLGAISSEELPFDKSRDFIIPRPFLPTKLEEILKEQLTFIKEENEIEKNATKKAISIDEYEEDEDVTVPITDYVESLADEVYSEIEEESSESDESIVSFASLNIGGVLDSSELSKINDILNEDNIHNQINLEKNDWKNIAEIIDEALEEVKEYEFSLEQPSSKPYNLILSKYHINELRPLLEKFDQSVIDKLSSGEIVDVRMSLKDK
jgi:hypothetical protein